VIHCAFTLLESPFEGVGVEVFFLLASNGFFTGFFNPVCDFFTGLFSLLLDTLAQLHTRHKKAPQNFGGGEELF